MGDNTAVTIVLAFIAVLLLVALVLLAIGLFVIYKYRVPLRGIAAMAGALVYLVSPIDVIPEAAFGPFGLIDDAGVLGAVAMFVYRLIQARQATRPVGSDDTARPAGPVHPGEHPGEKGSPQRRQW